MFYTEGFRGCFVQAKSKLRLIALARDMLGFLFFDKLR